ncbi:MAG: Glutamate racemase [Candidatus Moranbacteria bacterium GW2011_GWC1_45_18]|nr:MAG: Glutamate racemase [Candidatus Moranbacteria bacterium GW2011_GWC2_40_12]KKT71427.1 MAG: Glutamate racemase [Candidatus Moranbacteria bacterium GW2011_GWF1_44_4]KKU00559.1 MAG: Glutamate racemase [Candidatus Moranbacteria bacterium GW2011_GWC1_45_18]OGI24407.1 MAG: glutamate racemase [Candidatus Moranbacteria bacterium RIFOXYA1_FULL_44_8]OGI34910.1 MAG: glutamate racemase [Candidatus Moranbacteria bacterium RIFOXYC1_FULL_44_8]OGI39070.1 MAG: glutamate racemase [Candidatus Moranbacteria
MIGIFDSGVGGLTVVKEIKLLLPEVPIVYFGDTARLPYGNKSRETVRSYSSEIVDFLKKKGCKTIVIACNSASALAADWLREKYPELKIYDVVSSGAEAVAEVTRNKKVGVIGTAATINSSVYKKKIADIDPKIEVFTKACPLFVHLVEENWIRRPETKKIARTYLRELKLKKIDTLLLGCTHYPLLEKIISGIMGRRTRVIASGKKLSQELKKNIPGKKGIEDEYFVSDLTEHFEKLARKILGKNVKIEKVVL